MAPVNPKTKKKQGSTLMAGKVSQSERERLATAEADIRNTNIDISEMKSALKEIGNTIVTAVDRMTNQITGLRSDISVEMTNVRRDFSTENTKIYQEIALLKLRQAGDTGEKNGFKMAVGAAWAVVCALVGATIEHFRH
jgi:hypothetical protein